MTMHGEVPVTLTPVDTAAPPLDKMARAAHSWRQGCRLAITSMLRTLEARDPYASGHSWRVRCYCLRLAEGLDLDAQQRRHLSLAAKLHDIGKVGVPEAVLHKPGPLSDMEMGQVRTHPAMGERIVRSFIRSRPILAAIRSHHERYDGAGYPDALRGQDIPLLARIIAVADCFDAMTHSRPYRKALPRQSALEEIRAGAGTQFDPAVIQACARLGML
jgi:HD-GYP domain-containing protein (c-di-GMP phosphodiesterase class II)